MKLTKTLLVALVLLAAMAAVPRTAGPASADGPRVASTAGDGPRAIPMSIRDAEPAPGAPASAAALAPAQGEEAGRVFLPIGLRNGSPQPPLPPKAWCEHVSAGPPGSAVLLDLAAAHAHLRFFGVEPSYGAVDQALVPLVGRLDAATSAEDVRLSLADLTAYAARLDGACALAATTATLGRASVETHRGIATIRPGTGEVRLPAGTRAVVIDLRDLPAVAGLQTALDNAVAPALRTSLERPVRRVHRHDGLTDEVVSATNVYSNATTAAVDPPITATGQADLPMALLTGPRLAPEAAQLAGTLRMANRAWIVGQDVYAGAAEAEWSGIDQAGLVWRGATLEALTRPHPPEVLEDVLVRQDERYDPTDASIKHVVTTTAPSAISVTLAGQEGTDLDLFLLYDANEDGEYDYLTEVIGESATASPNEQIPLTDLRPAGHYQVWVHGYRVPGRQTTADLTIDVLSGSRWPDVIPADISSQDPPAELPDLPGAGNPPAFVAGGSLRRGAQQMSPYGQTQPVGSSLAELRAALVVLHGATRLFFPYFPVVGDGIDGRLGETWSRAASCPRSASDPEQLDRACVRDILRRFGEVLQDGHQFVVDNGPSPVAGYFPVFLEQIDGQPVVRRSQAPGVEPGDTIVSIGNRTAEQWYAEQYERTSAATDGYRFDLATRYLTAMTGPLDLEVRAPGGAVRAVRVQPQPYAVYEKVSAVPTDREAGPLADLGAPDFFYINMDDTVLGNDIADFRDALWDAEESSALVLDMRGYPGGIDHYEAAQRLISETFRSPLFRTPIHAGPGRSWLEREQFQLEPLDGPSFHGPIAFIVGPHTVSAAENFALMLVGAQRVTVVGLPSAGTSGNRTGVQLPGGFGVSFTGMEVRFPDGAVFHGVGIQPEEPVELQAADFKEGRDPELQAAIAVLRGVP
jgi:hypothetical protein